MNVKLKVLTAGVLFFTGQVVMAQETKKDQEKEIDEVVVVGYQKKKSEVVSSAVTVVSGESMSKFSPITTGANILQGKSTGLDITSFSGKPGSGAQINVRGLGNVTTTQGASNPLFVIDGVIIGNDDRSQTIFNAINPNDYESISVLKDAAAAAIYGSQGANGVIVVTTKTGKSGRPVLNFTSRLGFSEKIKDINFSMMNATQKVEYENKMAAMGITNYTAFTSQEANEAIANNHDWQKDILRTSFIESYLLSVRGGNESAKYAISLGHDSDNGIIQNIHAYKRLTGRFKVDATPNKRLNLGAGMGVNYGVTQDPRDRNNVQNPIRAMYDYNPYEKVYNADGSYNSTYQGFPILEALKNNPEFNKNIIIDGNVYAQYKIIEGLSVKSLLGGYFNNYRYDYRILRGSFLDNILGLNGDTSQRVDNRFKYTNTNTINYVKNFGNHNFDLLGLVEYTEFRNEVIRSRGRNFSSPTLSELSNASTPFQVAGYKENYKTFSYGSFLSYDYDNKYIVTGSIRQDADSRFGANNVYSQPFWSASIAWNIARENFLSNLKFINTFKVRASIGTRGYNNIALNLNNVLLSGGINGSYPTVVANNNYGNPDLKWEVTKSQNYGAELGMFNNRLRFNVDYFIDKKVDFLLSVPNYSSEGGEYATTINAGDLTNKGLELSLAYDILKSSKGFNWSVRANSTFMKYNLNKLNGSETERIQGINILREGLEPFTFYLVRSVGVNSDNGNEIYLDKDGNKTEIYSPSNVVAIDGKSPLPSIYGGFNTTFSFKGFDLNADFNFKYGNYTYNYMARNMLNFQNGAQSNMRVDAVNYWTTKGQTDVLPKPNTTKTAPNGVVGLQITDRFLQDASYLRLRNVSIGYTFNKQTFGESFPVNKIRISLTGQNLATWTKFEGDPEVSIGSAESQTGAGQTFISGAYSLYSYPNVKTYLMGIEIEF